VKQGKNTIKRTKHDKEGISKQSTKELQRYRRKTHKRAEGKQRDEHHTPGTTVTSPSFSCGSSSSVSAGTTLAFFLGFLPLPWLDDAVEEAERVE
jgi:hypothetical protein